MMRKILVVTVVLAPVFFAWPESAKAASAQTMHFNGLGVTAFFDNVSGCIDTRADVLSVVPNDNRSNLSNTQVFVQKYDLCANADLIDNFGSSAALVLQIDHTLLSGSLTGTMTLPSILSGGSDETVFIALTWAGTGSIFRGESESNVHANGITMHTHFSGANRDGAASGSVSDGVNEFTPSADVFASLFSENAGFVTIAH